ncbi:cornichon, partial [Pavlovales sp. CCMP2436]
MAAAAFYFWLLAFLVGAGLVFCCVVHIITYSDLESDYLNPLDATERLNRFLIPEYVAHTALTILFLLSLNFVPLIANGALSAWHVKCYLEKQHLVDATRIYPMLAERKKQCLVKLGFY